MLVGPPCQTSTSISPHVYIGDTISTPLGEIAHGYGLVSYISPSQDNVLKYNGSYYNGEFRYGMRDGFGTMFIKTAADEHVTRTGYYSFNKSHGIMTYDTPTFVEKGSWRNNMRHGKFITSYKQSKISFESLYVMDKLIVRKPISYVDPATLQTSKFGTKAHRSNNCWKDLANAEVTAVSRGTNASECIICCGPLNATSINCGHVVACFNCLSALETCPICRKKITKCLQLYL